MVKYLPILVLFAANIIDSRKLLTVTQLTCKSMNSSFVTFATCQYSNIDQKPEVNIYAKLHQVPVDNCKVTFKVKMHNGEKTNIILKNSFDVCEFMKNRQINRVVNTVYTILGFDTYSNINHSCPYNHDIILNKARFDEKYMNLIPVPLGQFSIDCELFVNEVRRALLTMSFKYHEK